MKVELPSGKIVNVTNKDFNEFQATIRRKIRSNDETDFEIKNERRGYALYWQAHPDEFAEDYKEVAWTAMALLWDGVDHICELRDAND